jgi:hypothetical protein
MGTSYRRYIVVEPAISIVLDVHAAMITIVLGAITALIATPTGPSISLSEPTKPSQ